MRRILLVVSLLFLLPLCTKAQDTPSVEVFGGYSYFHAETGRDLHGWNGSVAANLNRWFGLVADVSGHYDSSSSNLVVTIPDFPTLPGLPCESFRQITCTSDWDLIALDLTLTTTSGQRSESFFVSAVRFLTQSRLQTIALLRNRV